MVLHAPGGTESLARVHELLARIWAAAPDVHDQDRLLFETAVAEVAANIVEHAGGGREVPFTLRVSSHPDRVEAAFSDSGGPAPVDLGAAALPADLAETGRGLGIATAALDELAYERDGAVNRWRLVRRRRPAAGA